MSIFVSNEHWTTSLEIGPRTELAAQFAAKLQIAHLQRSCKLRVDVFFDDKTLVSLRASLCNPTKAEVARRLRRPRVQRSVVG